MEHQKEEEKPRAQPEQKENKKKEGKGGKNPQKNQNNNGPRERASSDPEGRTKQSNNRSNQQRENRHGSPGNARPSRGGDNQRRSRSPSDRFGGSRRRPAPGGQQGSQDVRNNNDHGGKGPSTFHYQREERNNNNNHNPREERGGGGGGFRGGDRDRDRDRDHNNNYGNRQYDRDRERGSSYRNDSQPQQQQNHFSSNRVPAKPDTFNNPRISVADFFHMNNEELRDVCRDETGMQIKSSKGELIYKTLLLHLLGDRALRGRDRQQVRLLQTQYDSLFILSIFLNQGTNFRALFPEFGGHAPDYYGQIVLGLIYESANRGDGKELGLVNLTPWLAIVRSVKEWIDAHVNFDRTYPSVEGGAIVWRAGASGDVKWTESILHEYDSVINAPPSTHHSSSQQQHYQSQSSQQDYSGSGRNTRAGQVNYQNHPPPPPAPTLVPPREDRFGNNGRGPGGNHRSGGNDRSDRQERGGDRPERTERTDRDRPQTQQNKDRSNNNNNQNSSRKVVETTTAGTATTTHVVPTKSVAEADKDLPNISFRNLVDLSPKLTTFLVKESKTYTERYGNTLNFVPPTQGGHVFNDLRLRNVTVYGEPTKLTWTGAQCEQCDAFLARCKVQNKFWNLLLIGPSNCPRKRGSEWIGGYQRRLDQRLQENGEEFMRDKFSLVELRDWGFASEAASGGEGK